MLYLEKIYKTQKIEWHAGKSTPVLLVIFLFSPLLISPFILQASFPRLALVLLSYHHCMKSLGQGIHTKDSPGVYLTGEETNTDSASHSYKDDLHESVYYPIKLILHAFHR